MSLSFFSSSPEEKKPIEEIVERTHVEIREKVPEGIIALLMRQTSLWLFVKAVT